MATVHSMICPNRKCNFTGAPKKKRRASILLGLVLFFFAVIPGVLYFLLRSGFNYSVPAVRDADRQRRLAVEANRSN